AAASGRENRAAVDDRALDSAFENADANGSRDRPGIGDTAGELSDAVDMAEVGRRKAEPDASSAGDDLAAIGDAPGEDRGNRRNTREAGADRALVKDATGECRNWRFFEGRRVAKADTVNTSRPRTGIGDVADKRADRPRLNAQIAEGGDPAL